MGKIKDDLNAVLERDPAARSKWEVFFRYPGFRALRKYRIAHWFYNHNMKGLARRISFRTQFKTGVDIHPAAKIGRGIFIDHATGVVIGETAEIGDNVTICQGVTLGGTGKDIGKRHPTIEDNVLISAGAIVLGPITIGRNSKIGAGSVVIKDVPANSTVVGVPGVVVKNNGKRIVDEMNQTDLPDPVKDKFISLTERINSLKDKVDQIEAQLKEKEKTHD